MRKHPLNKVCKNCSTDYTTNDLQSKFCSIKCARAFNNHIYQKHPIISQSCEICEKVFIVKEHPERKRRYCSHNCAGLAKIGSSNVNWKGNNVGYEALHTWVSRNLFKPKKCSGCQKEKRLDAANISGEYKRELTDWEWLCRKCHMTKDERLKKMVERNSSKRVLQDRDCKFCGEQFRPRLKGTLFCSRQCYVKSDKLELRRIPNILLEYLKVEQ